MIGAPPTRPPALFRRRNFALRALEKKLGHRLDTQEIMNLFGANENVARQTHGPRGKPSRKRMGTQTSNESKSVRRAASTRL